MPDILMQKANLPKSYRDVVSNVIKFLQNFQPKTGIQPGTQKDPFGD
jgi:hypothetical protein